MGRILLAFAWAGVGFGVLGVWWATASGEPAAVALLALLAFASAAALWSASARDRRRSRSLPKPLARLAYLADERAVAFAWQWRRKERLVKVMRSPHHAAFEPTGGPANGEAPDDQPVCVYLGAGDRFVDHDVEPGAEYHYGVFVEEQPGTWSAPVMIVVAATAIADRIAAERAERGRRREVAEDALAWRADWGPDGESFFDGLTGPLADAIFGDRLPDGWEEIG